MRCRMALMRGTITKETEKKRKASKEYPIALMMKLGWDQVKTENAYATIADYQALQEQQGEVWFGTNALASGIGRKRRLEFQTAIANKRKVHMYFVITKTGGGENEIEYQAEVLDLESKKGGTASPESALTPSAYHHQKYSIWIKLTNLTPCTEKTVADFKFANNNKVLKSSLSNSCNFGYITALNGEY